MIAGKAMLPTFMAVMRPDEEGERFKGRGEKIGDVGKKSRKWKKERRLHSLSNVCSAYLA